MVPAATGPVRGGAGAGGSSDAANKVQIDPRKVYDLPELIDIAQRNNPETRIAWERAREAAAAVGLSESAYYPYLVASAGAGYSRAFLPFPSLAVNDRPLVQDSCGAPRRIPQASLQALETKKPNLSAVACVRHRRRHACSRQRGVRCHAEREVAAHRLSASAGRSVDAARQQLMMANVGFNATHQKVVFEVTRDFYDLGQRAAAGGVSPERAACRAEVEQAVKARLDNGLAIKPELLQAQQQSAQFAFSSKRHRARRATRRSRSSTASASCRRRSCRWPITRTSRCRPSPPRAVDELIDLALSQRPDLVIKLANLRAKQAEVRAARADFYPKVAVDGNVGDATLNTSAGDSSYFGGQHTIYSADVSIELPVFDGFERLKKLRVAEADLRGSRERTGGSAGRRGARGLEGVYRFPDGATRAGRRGKAARRPRRTPTPPCSSPTRTA